MTVCGGRARHIVRRAVAQHAQTKLQGVAVPAQNLHAHGIKGNGTPPESGRSRKSKERVPTHRAEDEHQDRGERVYQAQLACASIYRGGVGRVGFLHALHVRAERNGVCDDIEHDDRRDDHASSDGAIAEPGLLTSLTKEARKTEGSAEADLHVVETCARDVAVSLRFSGAADSWVLLLRTLRKTHTDAGGQGDTQPNRVPSRAIGANCGWATGWATAIAGCG